MNNIIINENLPENHSNENLPENPPIEEWKYDNIEDDDLKNIR